MRWLLGLLLVLLAATVVSAQTPTRDVDTESQPVSGCTLDSLGDVCGVPTAGQSGFMVHIPAGGNLVATIKPVVCQKTAGCSGADWLEDKATFFDTARVSAASIGMTSVNTLVLHSIVSAVPAVQVGIKVTAYTSGSLATAKVWAMTSQTIQFVAGIAGGSPVLLPITDVSGTKGVVAIIPTVVTVRGYNAFAEALIDAVNEEVVLNVAGAGQVTFSAPSGRTGESRAECRMGTGTYFGVPIMFDNGEIVHAGISFSTYPKQGHFLLTGFTECRIRAQTHTSGSHTPRLEVSPGAGVVRAQEIPRGVEWTAEAEYTGTQTDTVLRAAPGAGLSLYITDVMVICGSATAVDVTLEEDDTADILRFRYYCTAIGDGVTKQYKAPIKFGSNRAILVTTSAAQKVFIAIGGFTAVP